MALYLPPAFTLRTLTGEYDGNADFMTLQDTQTNDARNVELTRYGSIRERNGYKKMLNSALAQDGILVDVATSSAKVRGHYQIVKSGGTVPIIRHIVAAGPNLWNYYSSTASTIILTNQASNDDYKWNFTQIQDPRSGTSGTDDIIVGVNGKDSPIIWNGTEASATHLSAVTGSSGVGVGKFIASIYNRIYFANINDSTDVDSNVKVQASGFDSDGVPTPHVFPAENFFYVGGSDQYGEITGLAVLKGELIIFKKNSTYKFSPGAGRLIDTASLIQMDENIGCIAPGSIATVGNAVIFMSELGVYIFDGNNFQYIGKSLEEDLKNINFNRKRFAAGVFHRAKNQYWLSVSSSLSNHNDVVFVFDLSRNVWFPPYTGMRGDVLSQHRESNQDKILSGDHKGYVYELDTGSSDGLVQGYNVSVTDVTGTTISVSACALVTAGDGLRSMRVFEHENSQIKSVVSNASGTIVIDSTFATLVTAGTIISIGAIDSHFRTKDFGFGADDQDKLYRGVAVRAKQLGNFNFRMNYIIDFNDISRAGTATISQFNEKYMHWDVTQSNVYWDNALWGPAKLKSTNKGLRFIPTQTLVGKYLALRFANNRANEPWEIYSLDILTKIIGRRT